VDEQSFTFSLGDVAGGNARGDGRLLPKLSWLAQKRSKYMLSEAKRIRVHYSFNFSI
jgi:hypothetical protein